MLSSADWEGFGNEWDGLGSLDNLTDNDFSFSSMSQDFTFTTCDKFEVFGQYQVFNMSSKNGHK
jgi:hypothetical protein